MKGLIKAVASLMLVATMPAMAGDAALGEEKSAMCAACHGADGNSTVAMWPKLAGQHEDYLQKQLALIKSGARPVPEMAGIVSILSDEDMSNIAAYYSSQPVKAAVADPALAAAGELFYRGGNAENGTPACMACHGPAGEGNPLAGYPALAGQHSTYLVKMLTGFQSGTTWGADDEGSKVMAEVAARLSESEIKAVSSYIQGLYSNDRE